MVHCGDAEIHAYGVLGPDGAGVRGKEFAAVFGPAMEFRFTAGRLAHLEKLIAMRKCPDELFVNG